MDKETIKKSNKKEGAELQEYLKTMRRHGIVPAKKGKGAKYNRAKEKRASAVQRKSDSFFYPIYGTLARSRAHGPGARFLRKIILQHFFEQKVNRQSAQTLSRIFV